MDAMLAAARQELAALNERLRRAIASADPTSLDWTPGAETNSLAVLIMHTMGSEEFWVSTAVEETIARDRAAEFRTAGLGKEALLARIAEANERVQRWLTGMDDSATAQVRTVRGEKMTAADCIIHALRHAAEHVAHADLTYQLWTQRR